MPQPRRSLARRCQETGPTLGARHEVLMDPAGMFVGRLAPSPTGLLHLGHARSFLLAYWSARSQHGRLIVRLEDLDTERSAQQFVDATLRDLEWLGIDWDDTPRRQSEGLERIREQARRLVAQGHAYPCTCTRADLRAAVAAPQEGNTELRYSGRCRGRYASVEAAGSATLRFLVPEGPVVVQDQFAGRHVFDVSADCGDIVILRKDGIPSYQLAVVADDALDGVTEVVRGDDLLASAARQQLIASALGYSSPRWFHVPLVVDATGRRLAKRADDVSIALLREQGVDPRAVVGWVAKHSGLGEVARATAAELVPGFAWSRVPRDRKRFSSDTIAELLDVSRR